MKTRNIQFCYEYRDSGNYHLEGFITFRNPAQIEDLAPFEEIIKNHLFDNEYFYPYKISVPLLQFDSWDPDLDHNWYRFLGLIFTDEEPNTELDFDEFINDFKRLAKEY